MQAPTINPWAMPVGSAMVMAVILGISAWQRRQRKLRRERPPNTRKLLRPPGHTLSLQLENCEEKLEETLGITTAAGAIATLLIVTMFPIFLSREARALFASNGLQRTLFSRELLPALIGNIFILSVCMYATFAGVRRYFSLLNKVRHLRLGMRGEQAVAEALTEAARFGYRSFHDFPAGENWNIDHVVVGPGGVFAVETKTKSKRKAPPGIKEHAVNYDGRILEFPLGRNSDYVEQAQRNAKNLSSILGKATGAKVWVNPVLVLPGWYVAPVSNPLTHRVPAMPETALVKYLRAQPQSLSDQQIEQIAFQVEQKCRDVDF
jgi:hypothetical protein